MSELQDPADAPDREVAERPAPNCEYIGLEARFRGPGYAWIDLGGMWCFETARDYEGGVLYGIDRSDIRLNGEREALAA